MSLTGKKRTRNLEENGAHDEGVAIKEEAAEVAAPVDAELAEPAAKKSRKEKDPNNTGGGQSAQMKSFFKKKEEQDAKEEADKWTKMEGSKPFSEFDISDSTVKSLNKIGITEMFPVQANSYAAIMEGCDVLVQARTGSGKTLAFAIPTIEMAARAEPNVNRGRGPVAVVFSPTRELAIQIRDVMQSISGKFVVCALYGGQAYAAQENQLRQGVDIVVATPGRATDFMEKGTLHFERVRFAVLDEADHMLDIGFKESIEGLLNAVSTQNGSSEGEIKHQTMLFSATVPDWVKGTKFLRENKKIIDLVGSSAVKTADTIRFYKRQCRFTELPAMLGDLMHVYSGKHGKTILFTNTKAGCHELSMNADIKLDAQCLHGDMKQDQREATMKAFRENKFAVLIATDVAARGLDLPKVDLVIQAAPPADIDSFVHRAGRTGRAGRKGACVLLHGVKDAYVVDKIERHAKIKFEPLPPPSQKDILKAVTRDVTEDLANVQAKALALFTDQAKEILDEADPVEILAAALAVMSGYTKNIIRRGLLSGQDNVATIKVSGQNQLPMGAYFGIFRRELGDDLFMRMKDITLCQDEPAVCFDVPEAFLSRYTDAEIQGMTIEAIDVLPAMVPKQQKAPYGGGRGGGGYGGGGGRGGGYGGGGGGYGGRGGGGYGGGGGGGYGGRGGGGGYGGGRGGGGGYGGGGGGGGYGGGGGGGYGGGGGGYGGGGRGNFGGGAAPYSSR